MDNLVPEQLEWDPSSLGICIPFPDTSENGYFLPRKEGIHQVTYTLAHLKLDFFFLTPMIISPTDLLRH